MLKHSISVSTSDAQAKHREGSEQGPQPVHGTRDPDVVGEFDHFFDSHISVGNGNDGVLGLFCAHCLG